MNFNWSFSVFQEVIEDHSKTMSDEMRDFLDVYLSKIQSEKDDEQTNFDRELSSWNVLHIGLIRFTFHQLSK